MVSGLRVVVERPAGHSMEAEWFGAPGQIGSEPFLVTGSPNVALATALSGVR